MPLGQTHTHAYSHHGQKLFQQTSHVLPGLKLLKQDEMLVMNSITFKIPILTTVYKGNKILDAVKIHRYLKCNRIHYQYLHLVQVVFYYSYTLFCN